MMKLFLVVLVLLLLIAKFVSALSRDDPQVDSLIIRYWRQNKKYAIILAYLRTVHHVPSSMTWLKQIIKELGLFRRGLDVQYTALSCVKAAIRCEIGGVNGSIGYRQMWRILQTKYRYCVKRSTVMMLLKVLDPQSSERRQRHRLRRRIYQNKGPNYVWHLDGYDKLKPYGFSIHACIDGYSRKILWIKLASTNKEPKVILLYYLLTVFVTKGVPTLIRSDCGTENCSLAACHMTLRHHHTDEYSKEKSYRYGSSTTNTRIESWWGQLRKSVCDYWMNIFKDMIGSGIFNPVHKHCLAYVYCILLDKSLNAFKDRWNTHMIRKNRLSGCPSGVPDDLYLLPHLHGQSDYKKTLDINAWTYCFSNYAIKPRPFFPPEFDAAARAILNVDFNMQRNDITSDNAKQIYTHLINTF